MQIKLVEDGNPIAMKSCRPGLFLWNNQVIVKSIFANDLPYCVQNGTPFTGDVSSVSERNNLIVQPVKVKVVPEAESPEYPLVKHLMEHIEWMAERIGYFEKRWDDAAQACVMNTRASGVIHDLWSSSFAKAIALATHEHARAEALKIDLDKEKTRSTWLASVEAAREIEFRYLKDALAGRSIDDFGMSLPEIREIVNLKTDVSYWKEQFEECWFDFNLIRSVFGGSQPAESTYTNRKGTNVIRTALQREKAFNTLRAVESVLNGDGLTQDEADLPFVQQVKKLMKLADQAMKRAPIKSWNENKKFERDARGRFAKRNKP
jgi:hypothetical protein